MKKTLIESIMQAGNKPKEVLVEDNDGHMMGEFRKSVIAKDAKIEFLSKNFDSRTKTPYFLKVYSRSVNPDTVYMVDISNARGDYNS